MNPATFVMESAKIHILPLRSSSGTPQNHYLPKSSSLSLILHTTLTTRRRNSPCRSRPLIPMLSSMVVYPTTTHTTYMVCHACLCAVIIVSFTLILTGFTEAIATRTALENIRQNVRSLIISRSTFSGSGVHTGHWTGDNSATAQDMYYSIPGILNFQMFGIPLVGSDICGFIGKMVV